jgi:ribonuclease HI
VTCFSDSQLVVKQMSGLWRLHAEKLRMLFLQARAREGFFQSVIYQHLGRQHRFIQQADQMVNRALDGVA